MPHFYYFIPLLYFFKDNTRCKSVSYILNGTNMDIL